MPTEQAPSTRKCRGIPGKVAIVIRRIEDLAKSWVLEAGGMRTNIQVAHGKGPVENLFV